MPIAAPRFVPSHVARIALWLGCVALLSESAWSQARTEVRDPLRGLTFVSEELSDQAVNDLEVLAGQFPDSDRLTLGLSAMVYDNTDAPAELILWLRHEGRRWLTYAAPMPVSLQVDGQRLDIEALRQSQPSVGSSGRFLEKLEFRLTLAELRQIGRGTDVRLRLRAESGTVEKRLSNNEKQQVLTFSGSSSPEVQ